MLAGLVANSLSLWAQQPHESLVLGNGLVLGKGLDSLSELTQLLLGALYLASCPPTPCTHACPLQHRFTELCPGKTPLS